MAYDLHYVNPYTMLAEIPSWLLKQWEAWYLNHNLIGPTMDPTYRAEIVIAKGFTTVANHLREGKALDIDDLLPYPPPKPAMSPEQLQAALVARTELSRKRGIKQAIKEKAEAERILNGDPPADPASQTHTRSRRAAKRSKHRSDGVGGNRQADGTGEE